MDPSACFSYSGKKRGLRRIQPLYWDVVPVSSVPCISSVCSWHPHSQVSASVLICSFYLYFLQILCSALTPLLSFQPPSCFPFFSSLFLTLPVTVLSHTHTYIYTLDIRINSLDFSAHNLTVNRKWLTWISILRYEHGARAAFVYTIMLLKAFTLTNCLRSKEEKKRKEIQLSEMWEREEKRWIWSTDSMYLSKHPHV